MAPQQQQQQTLPRSDAANGAAVGAPLLPQPVPPLAGQPSTLAGGPGAQSGAQQEVQQLLDLDQQEVLASVESLYTDELKPYGRILRKRLAERAQASGHGQPVDIDIRQLRAACDSCPWLYVQAEEGGDWSALLRCRPASFVDVYSPQDAYSPELWAAAAGYFGGLDDANMVLPGGRYSCAQVLAARRLPFLSDRSLGQVCHIVQLAISQKKLLGYLNGAVVPYCRSQSMVKERCAERGRPCTSASRGSSTLATWEAVRCCLQEIIGNMAAGAESIPLSNMKRLFRSRFHLELSETALGYAKLSELLQDPRLRDVCTVRLQGHGYVVVPLRRQVQIVAQPPAVQQTLVPPPPPPTNAAPTRRSAISIADSLPSIMGPSLNMSVSEVPETIRNCFVQDPLPPCPLSDVGLGSRANVESATSRRSRPKIELSLEDISSPQTSPTANAAAGFPTASPGAGLPAGVQPTPFPATPSPCSLRAKSLPKLLGAGRNRLLPWQPDDACAASKGQGHLAVACGAGLPYAASGPAGGGAAKFSGALLPPGPGAFGPPVMRMGAPAPFVHLDGVNVVTVPPPPPPAAPPQPLGLPRPELEAPLPSPPWYAHKPLTPSTLGDMGLMVQNTFLQFNLPPPTPVNVGSTHRAHSLPRNMGSDRAPLALPPSSGAPPR